MNVQLKKAKRRLAIDEARQKLANIQKERNVRIFKDGQWEWVANPKSVADAQDELKKLEDSYSEWKLKNQKDDEIKSLESKRDALQKEKALELLAKDDLLEVIRGKMTELGELETTSYAERLEKLKSFVIDYNKELNKLGAVE